MPVATHGPFASIDQASLVPLFQCSALSTDAESGKRGKLVPQQETVASPTAQSFPNSQDLSCWRRNSFPTGKLRCRERNLRQQSKIQ
jgi:hypothetical protein